MFCFEPIEDGRMGKKRHKPETLCQKYILYSYFNNINVINFIATGAPFIKSHNICFKWLALLVAGYLRLFIWHFIQNLKLTGF